MNTQKQIFLIVVLFFAFVGGCAAYTSIDLTVRAPDQEDWHFDQSVERGALLFANNCRTCHGNSGQGGVGPQLNKPDFKNQDPLVLTRNKELIRRTISCGRAGTRMPAWLQANGGPLNSVQVEHLVDFITAPENAKDEEGNPTSQGWNEALDFAHNLNRATTIAVAGDTLATIAQAHGAGYQELADANGLKVTDPIAHGDTVKIPANNKYDEREVKVLKDNQDVAKVANSYFVGAAIIADLNNLNYKIDYKALTFTLLDENGNVETGLLPGETLELPEGATYIVKAGDTITSIAEVHGVSASQVKQLNPEFLGNLNNDDPIDAERKLNIGTNPVYIARGGDTWGTIATQHGMKAEDLVSLNGATVESDVPIGAEIKLAPDARYTVQKGDTLQTIADKHKLALQELARLNNLQPDDVISPQVQLEMPKINAYVVQGQSLDDISQVYSNVTAESLAQANNIQPDAVLRVGAPLKLPEDAWGSAPPAATNPGTGCVQYAVPNSVYDQITGSVTPAPSVTPPAQVSTQVRIESSQVTPGFDWVVTADGTAQPPNQGVVSMNAPASITFANVVGLHTITVNGKKDDGDFGPAAGVTRTLTFNDAGEYLFTCDYHPDMKAWLFVK
ncbi:MAG TPA: LysM peptidoglycan-binding domain-containing protein [Gemmatimonadales bacterium]|nr:LysM peptidoglycan-binding domain-containing protein [Gemmatimonadales bacterium]